MKDRIMRRIVVAMAPVLGSTAVGIIGAGRCEAMSVKTTAKNATRSRRRLMKDFVKAIQIRERREGEMAIGTSGRTPAAQSRS